MTTRRLPYVTDRFKVLHGDCLDVLRSMPDESVDAIVTDPPYGIRFMGRKWDYDVPSKRVWAECLRVLKPGGHLLAFAGTRTQHRMCCRIENAGFEVRDMIAWVYGCLDEATEVATARGVMPYHRTKVGDLVLCYDVDRGEYTYQPIVEIVEYDYNDTAYRLVGEFGEQVVSRNHRVIVERRGSEAFHVAETLEGEANVPVLEDLSALQQAVHNAHQGAGCPQKDVQRGLRECDDRGCKQRTAAAASAKRRDGQVRSMRGGDVEARCVAASSSVADVQQTMQWGPARCGVGDARAQRAGELVAQVRGGAENADDGRVESGVEGRTNVQEPQRGVRGTADQVRAVPGLDVGDGESGRVRDGAPTESGDGGGPSADAHGMRSPHQPRRVGQSHRESDVVCHERTAQGVRAWSGHRPAVVRVVPFHYVGKVWCLRVPTGAFVAVRNGVAFPTGNSGFPKSLDVSKAIDKAGGGDDAHLRARVGLARSIREARLRAGMTRAELAAHFPHHGYVTENWERIDDGGRIPNEQDYQRLIDLVGISDGWLDMVRAEDRRRVVGETTSRKDDGTVIGLAHSGVLREATTDAARQWSGWGTAIKPAMEPITVARKPLIGTVAENVLRHGTGAMNIDGCRVGDELVTTRLASRDGGGGQAFGQGGVGKSIAGGTHAGRWPANLIHDGSEEAVRLFPQTTSGKMKAGQRRNKSKGGGGYHGNMPDEATATGTYGDSGSAARFFYCAKASRKDRNNGLDNMEQVSIICAWDSEDREVRLLVDTASSPPRVIAASTAGASDATSWSTLLFGSASEVRCRPECRFTISTATSSTTISEILRSSTRSRTSAFTAAANCATASGSSRAVSAVKSIQWERSTGTSRKRDGLSTAGAGVATFEWLLQRSDCVSVVEVRPYTSSHPTVKPTDLMRYLCRLVTPPGGTVLDPFAGSGSTGKAAIIEGFNFIGIEREADYVDVARRRCWAAEKACLAAEWTAHRAGR